MKTYSVSVSAFATVIVEADNEEDAMTLASKEISFGDLQMDETSIKKEMNDEKEIGAAKRHADKVLEYGDYHA